jgi:Bifunctional DNA primase/polymerase, N-terminal
MIVDGYGAAAPLYIEAGWSSPIPIPFGEKSDPPSGVTGKSGQVPDAAQIEQWCRERSGDNVALRLGNRAIGIDEDRYKNKHARDELEAMLGVALPATWCSTSRDDGSGIYLFAVPPLPGGKRWKHAPVAGVEIVQRRHRYCMAWPSVHPEGRVYGWRDNGEAVPEGALPTPDDIAELPIAAIDALLEDDPDVVTRGAVTFDLTDGEPSPAVDRLLRRGLDACAGSAGRHDAVRDVVLALVRVAEQGEAGVGPALTKLGDAFVNAVAPDRPGGRRHAEDEYVDLVDGARKIVATTEPPAPRHQAPASKGADGRVAGGKPDAAALWLPGEFWEERDALRRIRDAARARLLAPDAVLHSVLTRVAADVPHVIALPAIVGNVSPLCYFAALIGGSGAGKTGAPGVARELVVFDVFTLDGLPLGSGEGMAEILFEKVTKVTPDNKTFEVKEQTRHNAFWNIDEGQLLSELGARSGTTILGTMRSAWSGQALGNTNASPERRRIVKPGTYTFGIVVSFQPLNAAKLLADGAGGTPQRFTWASATDPAAPDDLPDWPGPLKWRRPPAGDPEVRKLIDVDPAVAAEIVAARRRVLRGHEERDELDEHRGLHRLRVAALLSLLENPTLTVSADDWRLAGVIMDTSDAVRASVLAEVRRAGRELEAATSERLARRQVHAAEATHEWEVVEAARAVWRKIPSHDPTTVRDVGKKLSKNQRDHFGEALDYAIGQKWITEHIEPGDRGGDKRLLERGPERPA